MRLPISCPYCKRNNEWVEVKTELPDPPLYECPACHGLTSANFFEGDAIEWIIYVERIENDARRNPVVT